MTILGQLTDYIAFVWLSTLAHVKRKKIIHMFI